MGSESRDSTAGGCAYAPPSPQPCSQLDRLVAFTRLRQSGAFLTTSEGLVLQLVQDAAHPHFRQVTSFL